MSAEKQADIEAINRRNELLIKSLVDNHCAEARLLREQLLNQERKQRDTEQIMANMEIEINHLREDARIQIDQEEFDEIHAKTLEANADRL